MKDKSQASRRGIQRFRVFLEGRIGPNYGERITRFDVDAESFITAEVECTALPDTSLLRILSHKHWLAMVGPRGAITILNAPVEYEQFSGRYAFGMRFSPSLRRKTATIKRGQR